MVWTVIVGTIVKQLPRLVKAYRTYNKYESKAFARAWKGYPRSVRKGVRHGFVGGSVIGSVYTPSNLGETPPERSSDSKRKTRSSMGKPGSKRRYNYSYRPNERSNSAKCKRW